MNIALNHAALLLVDVQRDALHPDGAMGRAGLAPEPSEASRLVEKWGELVESHARGRQARRMGEDLPALRLHR